MDSGGELRALVTMNLASGIGWRTYEKLVERFGTAEAAIAASTAELKAVKGVGAAAGAGPQGWPRWAVRRRGVELAEANGIAICRILATITPRRSSTSLTRRSCFTSKAGCRTRTPSRSRSSASRRSSLYGLRATARLAGQAARAGFTVVSGLARGIDQAAHEAALEVGGRTIGVAGSGLLELYPDDAAELMMRIIEAGAVVSEFPLKFPPRKESFPRRNRIISGMSLGVVVVEAAMRSGSLITARHAKEQGREVFAVPGPIDSPGSAGPNNLIKEGAKLVSDLDDITSELGVLEEQVDLPGASEIATCAR